MWYVLIAGQWEMSPRSDCLPDVESRLVSYNHT